MKQPMKGTYRISGAKAVIQTILHTLSHVGDGILNGTVHNMYHQYIAIMAIIGANGSTLYSTLTNVKKGTMAKLLHT